jgi:hypothetical protein
MPRRPLESWLKSTMHGPRCRRRRLRLPAVRRHARIAALADQHHAERRVVAHAAHHHVHVARLEDLQRQPAAGKQHRVQGEQRVSRRVRAWPHNSTQPGPTAGKLTCVDYLQIIILALIQGITEFLPISSSAHLILPAQLLGWEDQGLAFDIAVHVGSLAAVVLYFRRDLGRYLTSGWTMLARAASMITPTSWASWQWPPCPSWWRRAAQGLCGGGSAQRAGHRRSHHRLRAAAGWRIPGMANAAPSPGRCPVHRRHAGAGADTRHLAIGHHHHRRAAAGPVPDPGGARFSFLLSIPPSPAPGCWPTDLLSEGGRRRLGRSARRRAAVGRRRLCLHQRLHRAGGAHRHAALRGLPAGPGRRAARRVVPAARKAGQARAAGNPRTEYRRRNRRLPAASGGCPPAGGCQPPLT